MVNRGAQQQVWSAVQTALGADLVPTDGSAQVSDEVRKADELILSKSLSDLKTPQEVLAWANAKARTGDFTSALAAYRDVLNRVPATEKLQTDYAQVLAGAGEVASAYNVVASLATTGITPEAEQKAREKVAAAAQAGHAAALRARLQQGLYKPPNDHGYDDSIAAGEELIQLPDGAQDAWAHLWLSAAYGQKHAAEGGGSGRTENDKLKQLRTRAVDEAKKAITLDPTLKSVVRGLYDPAYRVGADDDLDSLRPDATLDAMFADNSSA
jgi:hypothetical protein